MIKCNKCKVQKLESEMVVRAGKPSKVCIECKTGAAPLELEVAAGLGFRAQVEGESLVISQDNPKREDDPDNLTLSKTEAFVIFRKFAAWAGVELAP